MYSHSRKNLVEKTDEYVSPIKRMTEYEEKRSYRQKELEPTDNFWKEKEARLSELTSNRLNESHRISLFKEERQNENKSWAAKREVEPHMKSYTDFQASSRMDSENRPFELSNTGKYNDYSLLGKQNDFAAVNKSSEYSLSNIDRIQQRIQSILGKR